MARDEVDDTDMTAAAFRAAMAGGTAVRVVRSRAEYEEVGAQRSVFTLNAHLDLAFSGASRSQNKTLKAAG